MADIKRFVCCHQPVFVPEHPLLVPIQVGSALAKERFPGFLHDDEGENISHKNRSYCELTAQYWAWTNANADYCGFFHYRRYIYPDLNAKWPYRVERTPSSALLKKLRYDRFEEIISQYDLIEPIGENMYIPVQEHYARGPYHHRRDLELIKQIIRENYSEMLEAAETYLAGTVCYFGNIYVMRHDVLHDYCSWVFRVLQEFDHRCDISGYSLQERRVDGYLAERLFGIYLTFRRKDFKVLELPKIHFCADGMFVRQKVLNSLLPPGTARRAGVKRLVFPESE